MRLEWDTDKERANIVKHGLDFSLAQNVFSDPLGVLVYDRFENGEHRYHAVGMVGWTCLVLVHAYPDANDEDWVRVIGLRKATPEERTRYENGEFQG